MTRRALLSLAAGCSCETSAWSVSVMTFAASPASWSEGSESLLTWVVFVRDPGSWSMGGGSVRSVTPGAAEPLVPELWWPAAGMAGCGEGRAGARGGRASPSSDVDCGFLSVRTGCDWSAGEMESGTAAGEDACSNSLAGASV